MPLATQIYPATAASSPNLTVLNAYWTTAATDQTPASVYLIDTNAITLNTVASGTTWDTTWGTGATYADASDWSIQFNNNNLTQFINNNLLTSQQTYGSSLRTWDAWYGNIHISDSGVSVVSPEEVQRRNRAYQRQKRERATAAKRGRRLLLSLLDEQQKYEYARTGRFVVAATDGRVFRLRKSKTAELLAPDGVPEASYCIHLDGGYVPEDTLIAQMMLLRSDPAEFERIANITKLRRPPPRDPATTRMLDEARRTARPIFSLAA